MDLDIDSMANAVIAEEEMAMELRVFYKITNFFSVELLSASQEELSPWSLVLNCKMVSAIIV